MRRTPAVLAAAVAIIFGGSAVAHASWSQTITLDDGPSHLAIREIFATASKLDGDTPSASIETGEGAFKITLGKEVLAALVEQDSVTASVVLKGTAEGAQGLKWKVEKPTPTEVTGDYADPALEVRTAAFDGATCGESTASPTGVTGIEVPAWKNLVETDKTQGATQIQTLCLTFTKKSGWAETPYSSTAIATGTTDYDVNGDGVVDEKDTVTSNEDVWDAIITATADTVEGSATYTIGWEAFR